MGTFGSFGQAVAHIVGDYVLQSDWMATEKTKRTSAAIAHVLTYFIPFLFITRSPIALAIIVGTHFVIDRWRLARYVCWVKNFLAPKDAANWVIKNAAPGQDHEFIGRNEPWSLCQATGYGPDKPAWLAVWLLIVVDNVIHVCCNALAIQWFD